MDIWRTPVIAFEVARYMSGLPKIVRAGVVEANVIVRFPDVPPGVKKTLTEVDPCGIVTVIVLAITAFLSC